MKYEKCPRCGGGWALRAISCPDRHPGCLVLHQEYFCYPCNRSMGEFMDQEAVEEAPRASAKPKTVTAEVIVAEYIVERRVVRVEVENGDKNEWVENARRAAMRGEGEVIATKRRVEYTRTPSTTMIGPGINKPWEERPWDHDRL